MIFDISHNSHKTKKKNPKQVRTIFQMLRKDSDSSIANLRSKQVQNKKMASDLHRTAQPHTFAMFPSWRILQELVV